MATILGYFSFRHGLPLTLRSALYPLIGERIYGPIGNAVDTFAVIGTVLGVATTLGMGLNRLTLVYIIYMVCLLVLLCSLFLL